MMRRMALLIITMLTALTLVIGVPQLPLSRSHLPEMKLLAGTVPARLANLRQEFAVTPNRAEKKSHSLLTRRE